MVRQRKLHSCTLLYTAKAGRQRDALLIRKCFFKNDYKQSVIDTHSIIHDFHSDITLLSY